MSRKHQKWWRLGCLICATGILYLSWNQISKRSYTMCEEIHRALFRSASELFLTNLTYTEHSKEKACGNWSSVCARYLFPLGYYMEGKWRTDIEVEDMETYERILASQANDENAVDENGRLVEGEAAEQVLQPTTSSLDLSLENLSNYEYLLGNFYTVDSSTMADPELLNAQKLLDKNMKIDESAKGPKILIYHTHSQEAFADSVPGDTNTTIMGIGAYLAEILKSRYGIETLHHQGVYDLINGKLDRSKAYQLAEPEIESILQQNPSIEVVIDLHRDGVGESTHLVTEINGKATAQIMFFNGLSRSRANGEIAYLENPYIEDNLAFSLQMQLAAVNRYPGFTRHIYLKAYRYNMHVAPRTLLVEAGAQTNTVEEMRNAMEILADTLDYVLTE